MTAIPADREVTVTPIFMLEAHAVRGLAGTGTVTASGLSGLELTGQVGGILAALAAVVGLGLTIKANNRARRREYEKDLADARTAGREEAAPQIEAAQRDATQARRDAEFYRRELFERIGAPPLPPPPHDPSSEVGP